MLKSFVDYWSRIPLRFLPPYVIFARILCHRKLLVCLNKKWLVLWRIHFIQGQEISTFWCKINFRCIRFLLGGKESTIWLGKAILLSTIILCQCVMWRPQLTRLRVTKDLLIQIDNKIEKQTRYVAKTTSQSLNRS